MNRVQFQPGLSIAEFMDEYGNEEQCEAAAIASRWPDGVICPRSRAAQANEFRRQGRLYLQRASCC